MGSNDWQKVSKYKVIDNVLDWGTLAHMQTLFLGTQFPWYYTPHISHDYDKPSDDKLNWYKFYHLFYENGRATSPFFDAVDPILNYLKYRNLVTCRAFLSTYTGEKLNLGFHTDTDIPDDADWVNAMKVAVFYLNTNNGGTLFKNGDFVESIQNRVVIFNIKDQHAAITATDVSNRVVLNFNYF